MYVCYGLADYVHGTQMTHEDIMNKTTKTNTVTTNTGKLTLSSLAKLVMSLVDTITNLQKVIVGIQTSLANVTQRLDAIDALASNGLQSIAHSVDCMCEDCVDAYIASLPENMQARARAIANASIANTASETNNPRPKANGASTKAVTKGHLDTRTYETFINSVVDTLRANKKANVYNEKVIAQCDNDPRVYADTRLNKQIKAYRTENGLSLKSISEDLARIF